VQRLLRDRATLEYLCPDGTWGRDIALARKFQDIQEVLSVASSIPAKDLEVLMILSDEPSVYDIVLPIMPQRHSLEDRGSPTRKPGQAG
jgi:hypothetical protein